MNWLANNLGLVLDLANGHLVLALQALLLSVAIAVPLGRLARRNGPLRGILLTSSGLLYTIPSFPLLMAIPAFTGMPLRSTTTMLVALTIYGVALMVRSAADAFASVPASALESADAAGHSVWARFWTVELPLAGPVLAAGMRVVAVSTVSLVTIGAVVGIPGLGSLLTDGFQRGIHAEVLAGLIATMALALLLDALIAGFAWGAFPWARRPKRQRPARAEQ